MSLRTTTMLAALALLSAGAPVQADDEPSTGRFLLRGERDDGRAFDVELQIERDPRGWLLSRVERGRGRYRAAAPRRWRARGELRGDGLHVTYVLPGGGPSQGARGALRGQRQGRAGQENRVRGHYRWGAEGLREELRNETRLGPEAGWGQASARGRSPEGRLPHGGQRDVPASGRLKVVVPCAGLLFLRLSSPGRLQLFDLGGRELSPADRSGKTARFELEQALGLLEVRVSGVQRGVSLGARLYQRAVLPSEQRPWKTKSYYPVYEVGRDGELNLEAMYRVDGPLERFDRAFGLRAPRSAVAWERGEGAGVRPSADFRHGHFVRQAEPREARAEQELAVDLDGDGAIGGEPGAALAGLDLDRDGVVSAAEVNVSARRRVMRGLLRAYDGDGDGRIRLGEELSRRRGQAFDGDGDGALGLRELERLFLADASLRSQLGQRCAELVARLLLKDRDGDRRLSQSELRPGAWDFLDDADADRDGRSYMDTDNWIAFLRSGETRVGNRRALFADEVRLFRGPARREPAGTFQVRELLALRRGADGDFEDAGDVTWWGHCDAAALAGILFRRPRGERRCEGETFSTADQEALLVELAMGERALTGFQWSERGAPLGPRRYARGFHETLRGALGAGKPLLADTSEREWGRSGEVWNYAVYGARSELREAEGDDPYVLDVSTRLLHTGGSGLFRYRLHFEPSGAIRVDERARTEWLQRREGERSYLRYLLIPQRLSGAGSLRNPHVTRGRVAQIFGGELPWR